MRTPNSTPRRRDDRYAGRQIQEIPGLAVSPSVFGFYLLGRTVD